ncbi:hypothetical protein HanRHA438_Chr14g0643641 [Helianthus annuus]|nr:hypothetical protein HanRHA438_Chr14g0643641 [Helianthus annuus]
MACKVVISKWHTGVIRELNWVCFGAASMMKQYQWHWYRDAKTGEQKSMKSRS